MPQRQPSGIALSEIRLIKERNMPQKEISNIISESYIFSDQVKSEKQGEEDVPKTEVPQTENEQQPTNKLRETKQNSKD